MFTHPKSQPTKIIKNLHNVDFSEKKEVETIIDELAKTAADPYAASLPMIMSAQLGDDARYHATQDQMLSELGNDDHYQSWMKSDSFKAWMWGRVLLAANGMDDEKSVTEAKKQLNTFLKKKENLAFSTWAEGYYAALDKVTYDREEKEMLSDTDTLIATYNKDKSNHAALSDALWACVMDIQAAANANLEPQYKLLKEKIIAVTDAKSVSEALSKGLLRNASSNDYPAWALAIARQAAAVMGDKELFNELNDVLSESIKGAKSAGAKAEYALAINSNQLALEIVREYNLKCVNSRNF